MPKVQKEKTSEKEKERGWVLVRNNPTEEDYEHFDGMNVVWCIRSDEIAPTTGTPHIQAYAYFKSACTRSALQKRLPHWVLIQAKGSPIQNRVYCSKGGVNVVERGKIPMQGQRNDIHGFVLAIAAEEKRPTEEKLLFQYSTMVCKYNAFVQRTIAFRFPPEPLECMDNTWLWGVPGTGKTTMAKTLGGDYYLKPMNKWFDRYDDQDVVIIDELSPRNANFIEYFLKIWADLSPFDAEVKNGTIRIRPRKIVCTSNYSIEEMGWDEATTAAIKRRFRQVQLTHVYPTLDNVEKE